MTEPNKKKSGLFRGLGGGKKTSHRTKKIPINKSSGSLPELIKTGWARIMGERRWLLALIVSLLVGIFISPHISISSYQYTVGDYAVKSIKAPRDIVIEDKASTYKRRIEAVENVWSVYDYDTGLRTAADQKIRAAFREARDLFVLSGGAAKNDASKGEGVSTATVIPKSEVDAMMGTFQKSLGIALSPNDMALLQQQTFSKSVEDQIVSYINLALGKMIVGNKKFILDELANAGDVNNRGITVQIVDSKKESRLTKLDEVFEIEDIKMFLDQETKKAQGSPEALFAAKITERFLQPNLTFNKSETEKRKALAAEQVLPLVREFKKNQLIVGEGSLITEETLTILDSLYARHSKGQVVLVFVSIVGFIFLFIIALFLFAEKNITKFKLSARDLLFLSSFTCVNTILIWLWTVVVVAIADKFESLTPNVLVMMIPVAAGAMTVRFLLNSEVAIIFSFIIALISGMILDASLTMTVFFLVSSLVGAHFIGQASQRNTILKAGLYAGLFNSLIEIAIWLAFVPSPETFSMLLLYALLFAFLGGILSGLVVLSITPLVEWLFGYTSNIKLLELASLNHPVLKQMIVQAPGTYNHSTLVSSLAEGAAEAIQCNPLLAKVGALYHDIGKINKPEYFFENLRGAENKHDSLYPRMSGLILTSHVKEGVEMARRYNLGDQIADIIMQHHGTSLIYYFYQRAKDREDPEISQVDESYFRYPGPKPQTREAALVMLADIVEASSRSMKNPTPVRIQQNVDDMMDRAFADGQLDECNLTLKDLQRIGQAYTMILNGIFHSRIEYPEKEKEGRSHDKDHGSKQPEETPDPAPKITEDGPKDF